MQDPVKQLISQRLWYRFGIIECGELESKPDLQAWNSGECLSKNPEVRPKQYRQTSQEVILKFEYEMIN